ncbi:zinc finger BED domain-containing protein DAYSLEEPER-like [Cucumis melo var. makuwa]|uniref:Zinc finger BED domain-containing protein DAYSLEEPER-like n=1 Tax=Cucumis melo var. makuwa TaxID=1194695 RepID=A0A5A7TPN2_CUCMM|nr:zinc finger BED domain-containing protein DAYSLEEPER-like [Cucumis melo var. makuwa]
MTFYSSKSSTKEEPQRSTSTSYLTLKRDGSSSKISLPNKKDRHLKFEEFVSNVENDVNNVKSKLDRYLDESLLPRTKDFNILQWWKLNGVKYNVLYEIAKDVLAVPITTVASESAFSIGGRHVGPHRSQIHENLLEALMCTQDWLWAEDKHTPIDAKVLENVLHDRDLDDDGREMASSPQPRPAPWTSLRRPPLVILNGHDTLEQVYSLEFPVMSTLLNIEGRTTDTMKARLDLQNLKIRKDLHLIEVVQLPKNVYTAVTETIRRKDNKSNIVVHLAVHLPYEAKVAGLINYSWMYLIERSLCTLKHYV